MFDRSTSRMFLAAGALVALAPACLVEQQNAPAPTYAAPSPMVAGASGTWQIAEAHTPQGGSYTGTVSFAPQGPAVAASWSTSGGAYGGVGLFADNRLFVGWGAPGGDASIVLYRIQADGSLAGQWTSPGAGVLGTETATGGNPGTLEGTYNVVGSNPNGTGYQGTLSIAREGDAYHLWWNVGAQYQGIGFRDGDWLGVGWGDGSVGVVEYSINGNVAPGRWAVLGSAGVGVENLSR